MSLRISQDSDTDYLLSEEQEKPTSRIPMVLKWPGGKSWMANQLASIFRSELHPEGTYFEPFLGGGSAFFSLRPSLSVLSDINSDLIEFFGVLRMQPDELMRSVWRLPRNETAYYRVRASRPKTPLARAARFLYLNRTCWGGIYRVNRKGEFNVPFGYTDRAICKKETVTLSAKALRNAELSCADFEETMSRADYGDVVYLDPPYSRGFGKECFQRYNPIRFDWDDHIRLALASRYAAKRGALVCISAAVDFDLLAAFKGWWLVPCRRLCAVGRTNASRSHVNEALIFSRKPAKTQIYAEMI